MSDGYYVYMIPYQTSFVKEKVAVGHLIIW